MIGGLIVTIGVILSVALMTQAERKVMGSMQRRIGPNKVGYMGVLQPFADGLKQVQKETVLPQESSNWLFLGAPYLTFYLALQNWQVQPLDQGLSLSEIMGGGIQIIIAISEQGIYGVIYSGWAANSKYPFLGSQRSTAQMISYSVSLSLIFLTVIFTLGTVDLLEIMNGQRIIGLFYALFPMAFQFMISAVAETNRAPMDLPEAKDLVSLNLSICWKPLQLFLRYHEEGPPLESLYLGDPLMRQIIIQVIRKNRRDWVISRKPNEALWAQQDPQRLYERRIFIVF